MGGVECCGWREQGGGGQQREQPAMAGQPRWRVEGGFCEEEAMSFL